MVSVHDLKHSLTTLGERLADEELDELVREVDQDGEGQLNYEGQWRMWPVTCTELPSWACGISWVWIVQTGHHHHHRLAPLSGASASCGALFQLITKVAPPSGLKQACLCKRNPDAIGILAPSGANFRSLWSVSLGFTLKAYFVAEK